MLLLIADMLTSLSRVRLRLGGRWLIGPVLNSLCGAQFAVRCGTLTFG
jgi:hypothetical protein